MSHNSFRLNNQAPSATGAIIQTLNHLSDVSAGSPSAEDMLTWSGAAWSPSTDSIAPQSARGHGGNVISESSTTHAFPNPYIGSTDPNRFFWEYASTLINYNPYMTTSTTADTAFHSNSYGGGKTLWTCGFNFATAGVYSLRATLHIGGLSSSNAYIDCAWTDASYNKLGPITRFSKVGNKRNTLRGIIDASSGDVAGLYVTDHSGACYNRASYNTIFIEVERIA